jgi:hypothetical protein
MSICPIKAWISSFLVCNISHFDIYVFDFYGPLHVHGSLIVTLLIYVKQIERSTGY